MHVSAGTATVTVEMADVPVTGLNAASCGRVRNLDQGMLYSDVPEPPRMTHSVSKTGGRRTVGAVENFVAVASGPLQRAAAEEADRVADNLLKEQGAAEAGNAELAEAEAAKKGTSCICVRSRAGARNSHAANAYTYMTRNVAFSEAQAAQRRRHVELDAAPGETPVDSSPGNPRTKDTQRPVVSDGGGRRC